MVPSTKHLKVSFDEQRVLENLCRPLFLNSPVLELSYQRLTPDGRWFGLYSHPERVLTRFKSVKRPPLLEREGVVPPEGFYRQRDLQEIQQAYFGNESSELFWELPTCALVRQSEYYHELFSFWVHRQATNEADLFILAPLLKQFCGFFLYNGRKIVAKAQNANQLWPFEALPRQQGWGTLDPENMQYLQQAFMPTKISIPSENGEVFLSKRESRALIHLAEGRSIREVAEKMGLSPRTVEGYLANLKNKTGLSKRLSLINMARNAAFFGLHVVCVLLMLIPSSLPLLEWQRYPTHPLAIAQLLEAVEQDVKTRKRPTAFFNARSPQEYFDTLLAEKVIYTLRRSARKIDGIYVLDQQGSLEFLYTFDHYAGNGFFQQAFEHYARSQGKTLRFQRVAGVNDWLFAGELTRTCLQNPCLLK